MAADLAEKFDDSEQLEKIVHSLKKMHYFSDLSESVLEELARAADRKIFAVGETIFTMNQYDAEELWCFVSGTAQLTNVAADSANLTVEELGAGNIVGLEFVLGGCEEQAYQIGLVTTSSTEIITVDSEAMRLVLQKRPRVARVLLTNFSRALLSQKTAGDAYEENPHQRIISALFDMVERDPVDARVWHIPAMPKHRALGELAGATEVEAAEAVARLISDGVARREYPGLVIVDYGKLHDLAL